MYLPFIHTKILIEPHLKFIPDFSTGKNATIGPQTVPAGSERRQSHVEWIRESVGDTFTTVAPLLASISRLIACLMRIDGSFT